MNLNNSLVHLKKTLSYCIVALLTAVLPTLGMTCAADVLSIFLISERIYRDMLLATHVQILSDDLFKENIILPPFSHTNVGSEFRGFVSQQRLFLSKYNYLTHSSRFYQ